MDNSKIISLGDNLYDIDFIIKNESVLKDYIDNNPNIKNKIRFAYKIFFKTVDGNLVKSGNLAASSTYKVGTIHHVEDLDKPLRLAGYGIHACFKSENCDKFYPVTTPNIIKYAILILGEYIEDEIKLCTKTIYIIPNSNTNSYLLHQFSVNKFIQKYISNTDLGNTFIDKIYFMLSQTSSVQTSSSGNLRTRISSSGNYLKNAVFYSIKLQIGNPNDNNSISKFLGIILSYNKRINVIKNKEVPNLSFITKSNKIENEIKNNKIENGIEEYSNIKTLIKCDVITNENNIIVVSFKIDEEYYVEQLTEKC